MRDNPVKRDKEPGTENSLAVDNQEAIILGMVLITVDSAWRNEIRSVKKHTLSF